MLPKPYRSFKPWTGFTPDERKREQQLTTCPSLACGRAKSCVRAIDNLYCRRTHLTLKQARAQAPKKRGKTGLGVLPPGARPEQIELYRLATEMHLANIEAEHAKLKADWKAGKLDHLYGRFDQKGAWMTPPPKVYSISNS